MSALKKYLITILCGLAGVAYVLWLKDIFNQTETKMIFHILCDGFFVVGVVKVCIGLLIFSSNEGTFAGLTYSVKSFIDLFRKPGMKKYASYHDYKAARTEKKIPFGFLLICGLCFIMVSLVMLYFYYLYQ